MATPCEQFCDSFAMRTMDQTASRFNDGSAYAFVNNMNNVTMTQPLIWYEGINHSQMHASAALILQLRAVSTQPRVDIS